MITFPNPGKENTAKTLRLALEHAADRGMNIVLASSTGETGLALAALMKETGFPNRAVIVSHVYGMEEAGENDMPEERRKALESAGLPVVTAAHALSGMERGLSKQFGGLYPAELVAHTLRMFGQGTKVCVEIAAMALDSGRIPWGKPIVAVGGTGLGADTACVLTPAYTAEILNTRIHEHLCKPHL